MTEEDRERRLTAIEKHVGDLQVKREELTAEVREDGQTLDVLRETVRAVASSLTDLTRVVANLVQAQSDSHKDMTLLTEKLGSHVSAQWRMIGIALGLPGVLLTTLAIIYWLHGILTNVPKP